MDVEVDEWERLPIDFFEAVKPFGVDPGPGIASDPETFDAPCDDVSIGLPGVGGPPIQRIAYSMQLAALQGSVGNVTGVMQV